MKVEENMNPKNSKNNKNENNSSYLKKEQDLSPNLKTDEGSSSKSNTDNEALNNSNKKFKKEKITKNPLSDGSSNDEQISQLESRPKTYKRERYVKNQYKNRTSLLDDCSEDSYINNSAFLGFVNIGKLVAILLIITTPSIRSYEKGSFFETNIFNQAKRDFFMVISFWPLFYSWSYMSFFTQKLVLMGLPRWGLFILQHGSQGFVFAATIFVVFYRDWGVTHSLFMIIQACVHFMKMHSYTTTNRDLRKTYLEDVSKGKTPKGQYPSNINLKNFNYFLFAPTLCYEVEYPRSGPFRPWYALDKAIKGLACLILEYIIASEYIVPYIQNAKNLTFTEGTLGLLNSMIWFWIVFFVFLFEFYLNFVAEVTRFGDRQFYQDWWNCSGWDEWARKWNRPVHEFLFRHVYLEAINEYKSSQINAQLYTFLFSAMLHELVLALALRFVKPFLTCFMLLQIPLILFEKKIKYKGTSFGNCFFWFGLILGIPLITNIYIREIQ